MGEARNVKFCPSETDTIPNMRHCIYTVSKVKQYIFWFLGLKLKAENKAEEKETAEQFHQEHLEQE